MAIVTHSSLAYRSIGRQSRLTTLKSDAFRSVLRQPSRLKCALRWTSSGTKGPGFGKRPVSHTICFACERSSAVNGEERKEWLKGVFGFMDEGAIAELDSEVTTVSLQPSEALRIPRGSDNLLYLIREGTVSVPGPPSSPAEIVCQFVAGSALNLEEVLLQNCGPLDAVAITPVVLWAIPGSTIRRLAQRYPDLTLQVTRSMAQRLVSMEEAVKEDLRRGRLLKPYLVPSPKRGVIGNSKYADRLRKQVVAAARDNRRGSVLIFGEPGLEKDVIASLVHFGGLSRDGPLASLDCDRLEASGVELFGHGDREGLLSLLAGGGSLLLNNVHKLQAPLLERVVLYLKTGSFQPLPSPGSGSQQDLPVIKAGVRLLFTTEQPVLALEPFVTSIKVPPLRVRPADVKDFQRYFLGLYARRAGKSQLVLTPAALRHLESYSYPGNITELAALVERAAVQADNQGGTLAEDVFWFATQAKDRFRWNLLNAYSNFRGFLRSSTWPDDINFNFTVYAFAVVVAILFLGPQDREHNVMLTVFWGFWWPGIFLAYPFLGRVWCAVCPFMIYGELAQRWQLSRGAALMKWPREEAEKYGPWFLFSLFAAILIWEDVWHLSDTAALSSWLLLIITGGAVVCSLLFERRFWCRYLCPVGGMNGMFAKLAMTELRARQGVCSAQCDTYHCFKGGPAQLPEGLETAGCPVYSHPAQLTDNRNCVLCMTCLKACPHGSVEFRLRPPGIDLWTNHKPMSAEVSLMFMLLGAVFLHRLPELCQQFGLPEAAITGTYPHHIMASVVLLGAPGIVALLMDQATRTTQDHGQTPATTTTFMRLAYGYLPLVWGATLAHYLSLMLNEGGTLLPRTLDTFYLSSFVAVELPSWITPPPVTSFLQGTTLLLAAGLSLVLTKKLGNQSWEKLWGQGVLILGLTAELWYLIV